MSRVAGVPDSCPVVALKPAQSGWFLMLNARDEPFPPLTAGLNV